MAIKGPYYRGFFDRNAGKLLIAAFVIPIPLRMVAMATGATPWVADILFGVLIISAICGYIARWRRANRRS